ncbi:hypothetical protein [Nocardioides ferulae]|uniref:hypothetical protein n=1 Tax=Nocardioides ferulae TaxID=2340821 RepID=UPI000F89A0D4|nr:hypothetical protein [Nocardioides ferulae]
MLVAHRALPRTERGPSSSPVPRGSLALMTAAVAGFSVASIVPVGGWTVLLLLSGVALGGWFVHHERRTAAAVLPSVTFRRSAPLKWIYVAVGVLAFGIGTEAFIPFFGQELGGMTPLVAGFLGAALSFGWSVTQVVSANARTATTVRTVTVAGPGLLAAGLGVTALLQQEGPATAVAALWFLTLFIAGAGIGLAFPHLAVAAFGSVADPEEAAKASAGINTVFLIASAFSSALAGVLVRVGEPSIVSSAQYLLGGFAGVALLGVVPAVVASRSAARAVSRGAPNRSGV